MNENTSEVEKINRMTPLSRIVTIAISNDTDEKEEVIIMHSRGLSQKDGISVSCMQGSYSQLVEYFKEKPMLAKPLSIRVESQEQAIANGFITVGHDDGNGMHSSRRVLINEYSIKANKSDDESIQYKAEIPDFELELNEDSFMKLFILSKNTIYVTFYANEKTINTPENEK